MSEYIVAPKQDLVNIADAIREKTETTDGMALDEMAALIAAIEAGGGGIKYATGTISLAETTTITSSNPTTLTHNLGIIPSLLYMQANGEPSITGGLYYISTITMHGTFFGDGTTSWMTQGVKRGSSSSYLTKLSMGAKSLSPVIRTWDENTAAFAITGAGNIDFVLEAGKKYHWVVMG